MKEIFFVTPNLANGGAERVTAVLASQLAEQGNSVSLVFMKDDCIAYPPSNRVDVKKLFVSGGGKIGRILNKIYSLRMLMKLHPNASFVAMLPFETVYTFFASLGLHVKTVYSLRNDPNSKQSAIYRFMYSVIYPKADSIVFQTEDARNFFPAAVQNRGAVIPNPVSEGLPGRFAGERTKEIVSVGRLIPQKNYPMLLRAFAKIHQIHPEWVLRIYGKGHLEQELRDYAAELGVNQAIDFCGFADDVTDRINRSGIFAMASDYEGISNAMLEALATGVPCICTDCPIGGARMMIQDHENGILVPVGDAERMAEAMLELIEHPSLAEKISENAVSIREQLSVQNIAEQWSHII